MKDDTKTRKYQLQKLVQLIAQREGMTFDALIKCSKPELMNNLLNNLIHNGYVVAGHLGMFFVSSKGHAYLMYNTA